MAAVLMDNVYISILIMMYKSRLNIAEMHVNMSNGIELCACTCLAMMRFLQWSFLSTCW